MNTNCGQNPNGITEGAKVIANYGAMFPTVEGVVSKCGWSTCQVLFDDGAVQTLAYNEIKMPGERTANGSPIGIHLV